MPLIWQSLCQNFIVMAAYNAPTATTLRDVPVRNSENRALHSLGDEDGADLSLSHKALRACVGSLASELVALPVPSGATVAIVLPNSPHFVVSFLAITGIAAVAAPLNPSYTAPEFEFYLKDAEVRLVIVSAETNATAAIMSAAAALGVPVYRLPENIASVRKTEISDVDSIQDEGYAPSSDTVAMFLHTSGTTSKPKGVPLTHGNLTASIANIARTYELVESDRCLLVMPLFHVHGLMSATLTTLATGGAVVIPPGGKFSASLFWPSVLKGEASWYTAVPTIHQILLARAESEYPKDSPPAFRFIRSCSASLAPVVLERLEKIFHAPVLEAYAMTEASHQMTSNPLPKHGKSKAGSVGVAQGIELSVLDDKNEPVHPGSEGEVCIRGANVTAGYHNNAPANEAAFGGGWFHTGDQGRIDEDGYLILTGRIKELINRGGEKISPLEVDAVLLAHPSVSEAVSFAAPDDKYGEEVNASVILKSEDRGKVDAKMLSTFAKERIAAYKVPKRFYICEDFPRTATGKIQRRIVAKHFLNVNNV